MTRHRIFILLLLLPLFAAQSPPSDATALLAFKSKADFNNKLNYTSTDSSNYCQWRGVKCAQGRVVRLVLHSFHLGGTFLPNTLSNLDELRVLSLPNNSLTGPIPQLTQLVNLKTLFLHHNSFSGNFPVSLVSLHRLIFLDLSHNNLSGSLPVNLTLLDRLNSLRLNFNRFNGSIPPLNQSLLDIFDVSGNNFSGAIPVTPTLTRFSRSSFLYNPNLCGKILNKICRSNGSPFFDSSGEGGAASPPSPFLQNEQGVILSPPSSKKHNKTGVILGFVIGVLILIAAILSVFAYFKNQRRQRIECKSTSFEEVENENVNADTSEGTNAMQVFGSELQVVEKNVGVAKREKSGNLIFCDGETPFCSLEQLMRALAELLGRGSIGTTYKAVMDNQLTVTVKRLDAGKTAVTSGEAFERHLEAVGGLRHPNLVPVRAYFQAKQERLIIYDYQPNGSLSNLIHGSRSSRAKPLHWTSCLKIAEDVALGLAYIHQASRLVHGNLKSSNILLGSDFEACLTDYCLSILAISAANEDLNSDSCKAPEIRKSSRQATTSSDVYAFGVLLLELLTGKPPSQHPYLMPADMANWVRAMREDDGGEDKLLQMLVEVASICSLTSPEQRPTMRQVVKTIQEIKENALIEDTGTEGYIEYI
ncbi:putative inactive receptor kinase At5g67200 [Apium graveolens]|uniref:putative inactive receptor kinase At5g67200 n=1 Tax=Apium graveolens TaxID=4045 RepID=UPI003D7A14CA